ncbi:patatin-like phospholipase family protein [bacterium]|nr:patatin-like phospholipase family protein [bacterium]
MQNTKLDYTCIFGGGAIRGMAYVGVIKALDELGITLKTLAGSSVGAIFAGLLAVGYTEKEIENIFMKVNYELFKDIQIGKGFGISKGEIFLEWVQELLERKFYGDKYEKGKNPPIKFSDIDKNLVIITTNLANFSCKEFSNFKTPDVEIAYAIRISAAMPGLMQPVKASGSILVDGDLQKSWPLWKLAPDLYNQKERILEFRLEGDFDIEKQGSIDFINTLYSCVTSIATKFVVDTYSKKDKFDYIVINTGSTVIIDFTISEEKRKELIDIGYQQTMQYFTQTLKEKKKSLLEYYLPIQNFLESFHKKVSLRNFAEAYNELGYFYMQYIQEIDNFVERKYVHDLNTLKNVFLNNYKITYFLKTPKLKNAKNILVRTEKIQAEVKERINELQSFVSCS